VGDGLQKKPTKAWISKTEARRHRKRKKKKKGDATRSRRVFRFSIITIESASQDLGGDAKEAAPTVALENRAYGSHELSVLFFCKPLPRQGLRTNSCANRGVRQSILFVEVAGMFDAFVVISCFIFLFSYVCVCVWTSVVIPEHE
jgi:hypothetical protein